MNLQALLQAIQSARGQMDLTGANGGGPEIGGGGPPLPLPTMAPPSGSVDTGFNPAGYQRAIGNTGQAVADWEAHHPGAMSRGQIPGWVSRYLGGQVQHKLGAVHGAQPGFGQEVAHLAGGGAHHGPGLPGGVPHGFGPGGAVAGSIPPPAGPGGIMTPSAPGMTPSAAPPGHLGEVMPPGPPVHPAVAAARSALFGYA